MSSLQDDQQASAVAISAPADNLSQSRDLESLLAKAGQCLEHIFRLDGHNVFGILLTLLLLPLPPLPMMIWVREKWKSDMGEM